MRDDKRKQVLPKERGFQIFKAFRKPHDVQAFLDLIPYKSEAGTISPKEVIRRREANCFEGALFAAAALRTIGYMPLIVDMIAVNDDDHVIAVFQKDGHYGAIAKSNTTLLRYREPVYRSLRELVMSYFDFYVNIIGEKTLRSYSSPVDLTRFDKDNWMSTDDNLDYIGDYLSEVKHMKILTTKQLRNLSKVDDSFVRVCFDGAIGDGLYKPKRRS